MTTADGAELATAEIRLVKQDPPTVRHLSGALILEEQVVAGRYMTCYWSPIGQVWPEGHVKGATWDGEPAADAFVLHVDGENLSGGFTWAGFERTPDPSGYRTAAAGPAAVHAAAELRHADSGVAVTVHTRVDGGPFLIRWLDIRNDSDQAVALTGVWPFAGMFWSFRYSEREHLGPEHDTAFDVAYCRRFEYGQEADFTFGPIAPGMTTVDGGKKGRCGYGRPAFWLRNLVNGETLVCELAWGGNYEFSLDCRRELDDRHYECEVPPYRNVALFGRIGLSGHSDALRVLAPGETVQTPAVHIALFRADLHAVVHAIHGHVRNTVMPAQVPDAHIEIEANHRGYHQDLESEERICEAIDIAAEHGTEMFIIDAGWYGNDPNGWQANVGDWRPGSWLPNGMTPLVRHAAKRGMRFSVWTEVESVGSNSTLRREHPDWLLRHNGEPVAGGRALDLSKLEVADWVESEIARMITEYELDMFRIDHNQALTPAGNRETGGYTEDLMWRYYENFYALLDRLRERFPHVVFQGCAGGGARLDWGTLRRFHNTEMSDYLRMPRALKALNNATLWLPPEAMTRCFGTEWAGHELDGDVDAQLRLMSICRPIFRGIAPDMASLTAFLSERIQHHLNIFRKDIRPLLADCRVYHHTPFLPLFEPGGWCVLEYARPDGRAAVVALFRLSVDDATEYLFRPRGLEPALTYQVRQDTPGQAWQAQGSNLVRDGIRVTLDQPMTSELLIFQSSPDSELSLWT